jgi:hypothetical protein
LTSIASLWQCFIPSPGHFTSNWNKSNIKKHCSYIWEGVSEHSNIRVNPLANGLLRSCPNQLCCELTSKSCQAFRGLNDLMKYPNWWSNVVIDNHMVQETIPAAFGETIECSINAKTPNKRRTHNTQRGKGQNGLANIRVILQVTPCLHPAFGPPFTPLSSLSVVPTK